LLLLYIIGAFDVNHIERFKRTNSHFIKEDYYTLLKFLEISKNENKIITTPNILTEVTNFSNQLPDKIKNSYYNILAEKIDSFSEYYILSKDASKSDSFNRFGLTDCVIFQLAKDGYLTLTIDVNLCIKLQNNGNDAINFNHFRVYAWNN
jgi:hypothetical protein